MKDICPFCELPEPIAYKMVFEVGTQVFETECQRCPSCQRRYYTTGQVRKLVELVANLTTHKSNQKNIVRRRSERPALGLSYKRS